MNTHSNVEIAETWLAAFNAQDLEKLLSLYHEEAKHYSPKLKERQPETQGLIQGKNALREWWQDAFTRLPSLHYKAISITADDEHVWMEYMRSVVGERDMMVAEVLDIANGQIVSSRVYHG